MRQMFIFLSVAFLMNFGTASSLASSVGPERERYEQRKQGKHNHGEKHSKKEKKHQKDRKPNLPPKKQGHYGSNYHNNYGHSFNLEKMVRKTVKGSRDYQIWQVSPETYLVRYRKGNKYYTRYLYPYSNTYGRPVQISVNWHPLQPWILIPPIQLNINI